MSDEKLTVKQKYFPIIFIELYFIFTVLLFEFGPVKWNVNNKSVLYTFLIVFHIFLTLGYVLGIKDKKKSNFKRNIYKRHIYINIDKYLNLYINVALFLYIFITIMELVRTANSFNILKIIETITNGISNPESQYYNKFLLNQNQLIGGRVFTFLSTGLSFIYWPVIPVCLYKFKNIKTHQKVLTVLLVIMRICTGFSIGTNKFVFDPLIITATIIGFKLLKTKNKIFSKKNIFIVIIILVIFTLGFSYFISAITSRTNGIERYKNGYMGNRIKISAENNALQEIMIITDLYLTQGYYGMSLALRLNFVPCYGLGNNNFILSNVEELFDIDIRERMYQSRIESAFLWNSTVNWHTMYTWFANDVSFYGVTIIMFVIGFAFAKVWRSTLRENIFAIALLPLYVIMFVFMPCNNQIFSLPTSFMPFVFLTMCWILVSTDGKEKINVSRAD